MLKDILLEPLQKSACKRSLVFIDACATELMEQNFGRNMLSAMNNREFEDFIHSSDFQATFLSCSPGEKSYSSLSLKHGIWTHHLLKAVKGEAPEAVVRDRYITSNSLQDYLSKTVPEYIQRNTEIRERQTPWAQISSSNTFEIRQSPEKSSDWNAPLMNMKLQFDSMVF